MELEISRIIRILFVILPNINLMLRIIIILLLDNFENELYWAKNNQISLFDYSKIFQLKMKNIIKLKSQML